MTTDFDVRANVEADRHAQMMQKQRKTDSVSNFDPMIDWTTTDYLLKTVKRRQEKTLISAN